MYEWNRRQLWAADDAARASRERFLVLLGVIFGGALLAAIATGETALLFGL